MIGGGHRDNVVVVGVDPSRGGGLAIEQGHRGRVVGGRGPVVDGLVLVPSWIGLLLALSCPGIRHNCQAHNDS